MKSVSRRSVEAVAITTVIIAAILILLRLLSL